MVSRYCQPGDMERPGVFGMDDDGRSMPPTPSTSPVPSPILDEFQDACVTLYFVADQMQLLPSYPYATEFLHALDACRALAAQLPRYEDGPTQDQEVYITTYLEGFLTLNELAGLLNVSVQETRHLISPRVFAHALAEADLLMPAVEKAVAQAPWAHDLSIDLTNQD